MSTRPQPEPSGGPGQGHGVRSDPPVPKAIWTEADFDQMSWHDCALHAVAVEPASLVPGQLLVDLDYIVTWVPPAPPAKTFSFWVCPATLVFDQAWDLTADVDLRGFSFELSLLALDRCVADDHCNYGWTLRGEDFTLALGAPGYTQYLRQRPIRSPHQRLSTQERGGLSFEQRGYI